MKCGRLDEHVTRVCRQTNRVPVFACDTIAGFACVEGTALPISTCPVSKELVLISPHPVSKELVLISPISVSKEMISSYPVSKELVPISPFPVSKGIGTNITILSIKGTGTDIIIPSIKRIGTDITILSITRSGTDITISSIRISASINTRARSSADLITQVAALEGQKRALDQKSCAAEAALKEANLARAEVVTN